MKENTGGTLLAIEIIILLLACGSALYGIWTQAEINKKTAVVSTVLTALGVAFAIVLAAWKFVDGINQGKRDSEKRMNDLRASFAAVELTEIKVVWTFDNVPSEVDDVILLGELMIDTRLLSNEGIDRTPQDVRGQIMSGWYLEDSMFPILSAIGDGQFKPEYYTGEDPEQAFKRYADKETWVEEIGSDIAYQGPRYTILFPLNVSLNAAIALGKREDDVMPVEHDLGWHEEYESEFNASKFGFDVDVKNAENSFSISWEYPAASIDRAAEKNTKTRLTGGLPSQFAFLMVYQPLTREDYLTKAAQHFHVPEMNTNLSGAQSWESKSKLEIYINGLKAPHYTYNVFKGAKDMHTTHQGAYDSPSEDFEYAPFVCTLVSLE